MEKHIQRPSNKKGLPAGTAVYVGETAPQKTRMTIIHYENQQVFTQETATKEQVLQACQNTTGCTWINVDGLQDVAFIEQLCQQFHIHPLLIEDILNTNQRPKVDFFDDYIYIVLKMNEVKLKTKRLKLEQLSLVIVKNNILLTFQERTGDVFNMVRQRLMNPQARLHKYGVDYLAYALMDAIVDDYLALLERKGEALENLEQELVKKLTPNFLNKLYELKRNLLSLNKAVRPIREILNSLQRDDNPLISPAINVFLRDLYDHTLRILESIDTYREISTNMQDIYLSGLNNKMNETMKILTMFASIFIPLSFVASLYGMNFVNMPELHWKWGYYMALGIMATIAASLLIFFKRKKWI